VFSSGTGYTTCNISNGYLCEGQIILSPWCFCDYRVSNMFRSLLHDFYIAECLYTIYLWWHFEFAFEDVTKRNSIDFCFAEIKSAVWCILLQLQCFKQDCSFDSSWLSLSRCTLISSSFNCAWIVLNYLQRLWLFKYNCCLACCMSHLCKFGKCVITRQCVFSVVLCYCSVDIRLKMWIFDCPHRFHFDRKLVALYSSSELPASIVMIDFDEFRIFIRSRYWCIH